MSAWPLVGGLRAANDDIKWVRTPDHELPLLEALRSAWRSEASFRPLEVIVAHAADPVGLTCWLAIAVQAAGLVAMMLGVARIAGLCFPGSRLGAVAAVAFMALSPATTCSAWQVDSCSQTWTAALGAWAIIVAWEGLVVASRGTWPWRAACALGAIFLVGCTIKENFYGWSAGLGTACIAASAALLGRDRAAATRATVLAIPVIALPAVHIAVRFAFGALGERLTGVDGSRYQVEFGANLLINAALSLAGVVGVGPFHLATDEAASTWLRFAPHVAVCATAFLVLGATILSIASAGSHPAALRWRPLAFAGVAAIGSLTATLPMGSVSELYGMGANGWVAALAGGALALLWNREDADERALGRSIAGFCVAALVVIGGYGLASRALHFRAVWKSTESVNRDVLEFQSRLAPSADPKSIASGTVHFSIRCMAVRTYGQYVMPVAQAINVEWTSKWLVRHDPGRPLAFAIGSSPAAPSERDLVIDCAELPDHGHW